MWEEHTALLSNSHQLMTEKLSNTDFKISRYYLSGVTFVIPLFKLIIIITSNFIAADAQGIPTLSEKGGKYWEWTVLLL